MEAGDGWRRADLMGWWSGAGGQQQMWWEVSVLRPRVVGFVAELHVPCSDSDLALAARRCVCHPRYSLGRRVGETEDPQHVSTPVAGFGYPREKSHSGARLENAGPTEGQLPTCPLSPRVIEPCATPLTVGVSHGILGRG